MDNNELIQQARELCEKATPGPWKIGMESPSGAQNVGTLNGVLTAQTTSKDNAAFIAASRILVPQLCDALEAAQKENEELKNTLRFNMVQIHGERMTVLDALSSLTARAEKAEVKLETIHQTLDMYGGEEGITAALKERDTYKAALQNMRFAYVNKDIPPHQFEIDALKETDVLIGALEGE